MTEKYRGILQALPLEIPDLEWHLNFHARDPEGYRKLFSKEDWEGWLEHKLTLLVAELKQFLPEHRDRCIEAAVNFLMDWCNIAEAKMSGKPTWVTSHANESDNFAKIRHALHVAEQRGFERGLAQGLSETRN